jgi:hypothetical protein
MEVTMCLVGEQCRGGGGGQGSIRQGCALESSARICEDRCMHVLGVSKAGRLGSCRFASACRFYAAMQSIQWHIAINKMASCNRRCCSMHAPPAACSCAVRCLVHVLTC